MIRALSEAQKKDKRTDTEKAFATKGRAALEKFLERPISVMYFEPITFKAGDMRYTPDYMVILKDGEVIFVEVKGSKFQTGYSYSRTRVRAMKIAYPEMVFIQALKAKDGWEMSYIGDEQQ